MKCNVKAKEGRNRELAPFERFHHVRRESPVRASPAGDARTAVRSASPIRKTSSRRLWGGELPRRLEKLCSDLPSLILYCEANGSLTLIRWKDGLWKRLSLDFLGRGSCTRKCSSPFNLFHIGISDCNRARKPARKQRIRMVRTDG
jgi:hypothetical protein